MNNPTTAATHFHFKGAATFAAKLASLCTLAGHVTEQEVTNGLMRLQEMVESLPISIEDLVHVRNWVASSMHEWRCGCSSAAAYQVRQVGRRLKRLGEEWIRAVKVESTGPLLSGKGRATLIDNSSS